MSISKLLSNKYLSDQNANLSSDEALLESKLTKPSLSITSFPNSIVKKYHEHTGIITALEFHPFNPFFASGSTDKIIKITDITKPVSGNRCTVCDLVV